VVQESLDNIGRKTQKKVFTEK